MRSRLLMVVMAMFALAACAVGPAPEASAGGSGVAAQAQALVSDDAIESSYPRPQLPLAGAPSAPQCVPKGERCTSTGNLSDVSCCDGTACVPTACTQSIPPHCFGVCRAPSPPKPVTCFTSSQCAADQVCSTERGDCRRPGCAPGRVCPAVCAGVCVPSKT